MGSYYAYRNDIINDKSEAIVNREAAINLNIQLSILSSDFSLHFDS